MADYREQQNGKAGSKPQNSTDDQSSSQSPTSSTTPHGDTYGSGCGCGTGANNQNQNQNRKFHPWEPETWECESETMDSASGSCNDGSCDEADMRDSAPSELDEFEVRPSESQPTTPFAARANAADNRELFEDLVRSQRPETGDTTGAAAADDAALDSRESGTSTPMQWTLVDLSSKSCDKPGCDPATCDSDECEDEGRTGYQEKPEYATSVGETREPVTSYRFDLDREVGPAPEPMSNRYEPEYDIVESKKSQKAELKKSAKRGGKKPATPPTPVFPEQVTAAAPATPTTAGKGKKAAGKKPAAKTAKKGAKKPAAKKPAAKKTTAKTAAKKPAAKKGK